MGESKSLSLCVLIVVSVLWKPAYSDHCNLACKGSPTAPTLLNGHEYTYGVEGTVSVYLSGADKQETSIKILGKVTVAALGNCVNELRVQNLVISGPDGQKFPSPRGVEKPVRFTLEDGRVGPDLCSQSDDTRRALNIKRAIISLLQTENKPSTQVDIFGSCPTEASSSQEGASELVHRSRDLSRCAHREQGRHALLTAVVNPTAEIKDTQVLQSSLHVESKVKNGVPEKVAATEEYLYRPFAVGENGARAKVLTKLTLTGQSRGGNSNSQCSERRTIIFENPHNSQPAGGIDAALNAVRSTAKEINAEANSKSAGIFAELVRSLRSVGKDDLLTIYHKVEGDSVERRVFLDGLFRAGTGYSIEASIELVKTKKLSELESHLALLSLGNARHVNAEAVKAAALLMDGKVAKEVYIGAGALAGAYCRDHDCHNTKVEGVVDVSQKLGAKVNCKPRTKVDEDYVVAALKGIRNIHHLENNLVDKVARCASEQTAKARIRVAALEAFGADPCAAKLKKTALDILKNRDLDSEIRIKAYLAVIQCPCAGSAGELKKLIDTEPVNQVGRYITTSLASIRSSVNPDKYLARQHYGQIRTPNHFNVDIRKYGYFSEESFNIDALGVGGTYEESLIYSQDSFLPRSFAFNLTAEVFGHNFNVLEAGARQGNLDRVIEHFLGPKGLFETSTPQQIFDIIKRQYMDAERKVDNSLSRGRRSVKSEVDNFDKQLKAEATSYNNELDLDIYVKLFGTDAIFLSLGDDKGFDFNTYLDKFLRSLNTGISNIKQFQQELRANLLFLDAELAYPTSTGLPLKLNLVGAATGRLEVGTSVDIHQIYRNPRNAKVDLKLVPSTDIEISGAFLVDADTVATGVKVITNLHSSTGGHLVFKVIEDGKGFDIKFGLPIEKQELLVASNEVVYYTSVKGQKDKNIPVKVDLDHQEYSGCFDQLAGVLGLTLCGSVNLPFSLSGPQSQASISKFISHLPLTNIAAKIHLDKNDLRGYHLKGALTTSPKNDRHGFELVFETEGSQKRRTALSGEYVNRQDEYSVKFDFASPITNAGGQAGYFNKNGGPYILAKFNLDADEYYGKAGFEVRKDRNRVIYTPLLEYQTPKSEKKVPKIEGRLVEERNGQEARYTVEQVRIQIPSSNEVVTVTGHLHLSNGDKVDLDLKLSKAEHKIELDVNIGERVKVKFFNTLNPYVNFKVDAYFSNSNYNKHNEIDLTYGPNFDAQGNDRVTFKQLLKTSPENLNTITKNKFEIHALPLKLELNADVDSKKVVVDAEGIYLNRQAKFELDAKTHIKKPGDYSVRVSGEVDGKGAELFSKRDIESEDKSNFENYIQVNGVGKYELSGVVLHRTKPNNLNVGAVGHFSITANNKKQEIKFDVGAIETSHEYSTHATINSGQLLDFLLKVKRGSNPDGQFKLSVQGAVKANGNFKVTDADGRGHGLFIAEFPKTQSKIKADLKFLAKEPVFSADADVTLNYNDKTEKLEFHTYNKVTPKTFESKNKLISKDATTELNLYRDLSNPKGTARLEIVLPNGRALDFQVDKYLTVNNDAYNGEVTLTVSDALRRGGDASTITVSAKLADTNIKRYRYDVKGQVDLKLKNGRNLQNTYLVKNIPEGDKFKYDLKTEVTGNLLPKKAFLSASGETTDSFRLDYDKYHVKGNYGDDIQFELVGEVNADLHGKDKKIQENNSLTLRLPFEKARDVRIVSNVQYLQPNNQETIAEYTLLESVQINGELYKIDANGKIGDKTGFTKLKYTIPHNDVFVLDLSYHADFSTEQKRLVVDAKSQYGKGKTASITVKTQASAQEYGLLVQASSPQAEKLKNLELKIITKVPSSDSQTATLAAVIDGNSYEIDILTVRSKVNPVLDLTIKCPQAQPTRIYIKGEGLSSTQGKLDLKLLNVKNFSLDAQFEGIVEHENVDLKLHATSEALELRNYDVAIKSKDAGKGKRLEFHATNAGKNVFSGSTSFISKQEGSKAIIEGSGTIKVKEEQKSASFKSIRTVLFEGNEQGVETFLDLTIGERSYVAESRITNLEYKTSYVYCEEKKQCANIELQAKLNSTKPGVYQHVINVGFDLRKLGFAPEFGLQISNELGDHRLPQHTLDLHVNYNEKRYHLKVYSHPEQGRFPAGITVALPQRVLSLESYVSYPRDKALPFPISGEVTLHLDKNKPQLKTSASFLVDLTANEREHAAVAKFGFSHPRFAGKEAVVKLSGGIKRPSESVIVIETLGSVSLPNGEVTNNKFFFEARPGNVKLLVECPIGVVIDLNGKAVTQERFQQAELTFRLLQGKPVVVQGQVKNYQYFEFTTGYSDESQRKLSVVAHLDPEKRVDVSADIILPNEKKNIIYGALYLQDNLVKSDYKASKENFRYFLDALKKDVGTLKQRVKQLGEQASQKAQASAQRQAQLVKEVNDALKQDLDKLYKEVTKDKGLQDISVALHDIIGFLAKMIDDVIIVTKPIVEMIDKTFTDICRIVREDLYKKQIEPQLNELYESLYSAIKEYFDGLLDLVAHIAALIDDSFQKYKPELQELTNTIAEAFKDLTRIAVAQLKALRERFAGVFTEYIAQLKEILSLQAIQEKLKELEVPQQVLELLSKGHVFIRDLLPTDELRAFADALYQLVKDILSSKDPNNKAQSDANIGSLYEKAVAAATSLAQLVRAQLNQLGVTQLVSVNTASLLSGPAQISVPGLGGFPAFAVLNSVVRGDVLTSDLLAYINAYRPKYLNPLDEIPSKLRAVIVNGQHIFTFDGRHLTFPGSCRYVLAHDYVDRNFTLVLQLSNGAPQALVLEDKSGSFIELKANGQVALNGKTHGFPVMEKDVFAFRQTHGSVGVGSRYGLMAICSSKLEVCFIEVNGFYLGKLRGLLGDGNNEPYDDFRMRNGKITSSESEFGNSYKLAGSCPSVKTPEHSHHQLHAQLPPACEQVFGSTSNLRPLDLFLDNAPFRQACIHACATGDAKKDLKQACDLASGYTALAVSNLLPAVIPPVCLRCTDGDKPLEIGDTYSTKVSGKKADIVVAVEVTQSNEQNFKKVVVPLVGQLVDTLKKKGVNDIKIYLLGITPEIPYPIIYDTDLKLKNDHVKFDQPSRYKVLSKLHTGINSVDSYIDRVTSYVNEVKLSLGISNVIGGYNSIFELPLRPGAAKHSINVVGERCSGTINIVRFLRSLSYTVLFDRIGYSHSLVTPTQTLVLPGKDPKQIVGFSKNAVLLLGEQKPSADAAERARNVVYDTNDDCIDFVKSTGGFVFSSSNYQALDAGKQRQFLGTAVSAITAEMLTGDEQLCVCRYVDAFTARTVCTKTGDGPALSPGRRK